MSLVVEHVTADGRRVRTRRGLHPLDQERRALAEAHVRLGYARAHARARKGMDFAEALSVALGAVVEAASRFEPGRGTEFAGYCDLVVRSKLADAAAREARYAARHARQAEDGQEDRTQDDRGSDPGRAAAATEMVDRLRGALPAEVFRMLWEVFAEGRSLAEAGRDREVTRQRAHQVVARGIARARRVLNGRADDRSAEQGDQDATPPGRVTEARVGG